MDTNVDTTFEGDNTILMQQVAKILIAKKPSTDNLELSILPGKPLTDSDIARMLQFRCAPNCPAHFQSFLDVAQVLSHAVHDFTLHCLLQAH